MTAAGTNPTSDFWIKYGATKLGRCKSKNRIEIRINWFRKVLRNQIATATHVSPVRSPFCGVR